MNVAYPISTTNLNPTLEFYEEVLEMKMRAEKYITGFRWCDGIKSTQLYYNLGSAICVFLFNIENNQSLDVADNKLWVIVGDIPSMYLDTFDVKSVKEVLAIFSDLGEDWADNILANKSVEDCFPFEEKPSVHLANLLKSRISFIRTTLLEEIEDVKLADDTLNN